MLRRLYYQIAYYRTPPWDTGITPPEVRAFLAATPPGRALDLGCGSGTNALSLASCGWQVTGVDYAWRAIQLARRKARAARARVDFRVGDVAHLPGFNGLFDFILDIGCFHGLPANRAEDYAQNIQRWLQPAGVFMLYGFLQNHPGDDGPGLSRAHLDSLTQRLSLVARSDGSDSNGLRRSAWFTFKVCNISKSG